MKLGKRMLSLLLVVFLLVGSVPLAARAENGPDTSVDTGDISIEGTNGFGTLLSNEIAQHQSESAQDGYPGGYTVTGLEINGNQATVTYDAMEEANLVVALYTEDGVQLLNSAAVTVSPEETQALVTFEGEMPQYFMASAYLLDSYDHSPLCASYDTPMYTREMQELLASTVDDYDPDRVLNLDSDRTTNFAVYAEDTIVIDYVPGTNTISSMDDESRTYVIGNADAQITGLQPGDVFAYPYGVNEFLIVKVGSIQLSGTTATITGADLELEEVFSHVKLDGTTGSDDVVVTDLDPDDGIDYQGSGSGLQPQASTMAWEGDGGIGATEHFGLDKTFQNTAQNKQVTIQGGLDFSLRFKYQFYVSPERQYLQFTLDATVALTAKVSGEISADLKSFAKFKVGPFQGVTFTCEPTLMISFGGEVQFSAAVSATLGFAYDSEKGFANLCSAPKATAKLDVAGEFFFGVDLNPDAVFVSKYIAELDLSIPIGLTVAAELTGTDFDEMSPGSDDVESVTHACRKCLDITVSVQPKLELTLKFLNCDRLTYQESYTTIRFSWPFYYSFTYNEFGKGSCPYESYRVIVEVKDTEGNGVPGAVVKASQLDKEAGETSGTTNSHGTLVFYLPSGDYAFYADVGKETCYAEHTVSDACKITLAVPVEMGQCGENVYWYLYPDGQLLITGTGPMYDYYAYWNSELCDRIKRIIIEDGVTTICPCAFLDCRNLTSVTLPDSITDLGTYSFDNCVNLTSIKIPNGVTSINGAFMGCIRLRSVTISNSVTVIGDQAFQDCYSLTSVTIPNSVTSIGANAFLETNLRRVTIPDSVTYIGTHAFCECNNLVSVVIGDGVTTIDGWAFVYCSSLVSVAIGASVTSIGDGAFYGCRNLTNVVFRGPLPAYIGESNDDLFGGTGGADSTSTGTIDSAPGGIQLPDQSVDEMNPAAVFDGEYSAEATDKYTIQTASFTGLVPGAQYVLLALADKEIPNPLDAENLIFIDQVAAGEDGTLSFRYAQRVPMDVSYVIACGPSNKNLADATITFPEMTADGNLQLVNPTVTYGGKTLTEGVDYVITGTVEYTAPGTYTCYIRGIHNYTGLVECRYTVKEPKVIRLAGAHRWATSLMVADEMKANLGVEKFESIIIASGNDFADALAGSYLSTVKNAPILLAWGKGGKFEYLDTDNIEYIKANLAEGGTVYILGGTNAVPELYENELKGYTVKRLGGANRFETNLLILAEAGVNEGDEILVCTSTNFADSLSASATGKPILLVFNELGKLYGKQPEYLASLKNCTFTVIGGESAVSAKLADEVAKYGSVERLAGANRFETSVLVAEEYFENPETAVLAYAWNYPDGLCGGSLAFSMDAPLILTMTKYEAKAVEYAKSVGIETGIVLGGDTLISDDAVRAIFAMEASDEIIVKK